VGRGRQPGHWGITVFERLKGFADAGDTDAGFECQGCGTSLEAQRQVCPECGGYHIDRADW